MFRLNEEELVKVNGGGKKHGSGSDALAERMAGFLKFPTKDPGYMCSKGIHFSTNGGEDTDCTHVITSRGN